MRKDLVCVGNIKVKDTMRTNLGVVGKKSDPLSISSRHFTITVGSFKANAIREVTLEVRSVNFSLKNMSLVTKTNHNMITVSRYTRTLGLPSITHVLTTTRQKDIVARGIMLIGNLNSASTIANECKINDGTKRKTIMHKLLASKKVTFLLCHVTYFGSLGQIGTTVP